MTSRTVRVNTFQKRLSQISQSTIERSPSQHMIGENLGAMYPDEKVPDDLMSVKDSLFNNRRRSDGGISGDHHGNDANL